MSDSASARNSPCTIGVLGAGGFTGARIMQLAALRDNTHAVALIRGFRSLGKLSAAPVSSRMADTRTAPRLAESLAGLDAVVNVTLGEVADITAETRIMVEACRAAGVPRFIHASSAVVYGRAGRPDIPEDAPPEVNSWMLYAREKARAEVYLKQEMSRGGLDIIVLRPGLIWGPGSNWSRMVAEQLLRGGMTLLRKGQGICNLVQADNLASMILHAAASPAPGSIFCNARDAETLTWLEFCTALANALDVPPPAIRTVDSEALRFSPKRVLEWALNRRPLYRGMRRLLKSLSPEAKQSLKRSVNSLTGGGPVPPAERISDRDVHPSSAFESAAVPKLSREHWVLQTTGHALPSKAFNQHFGPAPLIPFEEGIRRTAAWLRFVSETPHDLFLAALSPSPAAS